MAVRYTIAMENLRDGVAVVTGAASGIGLATAQAFVAAGMRVVLADVDEAGVRREASALGDDAAHGVAVDVRDPSSVEALAAAAVDRFGAVHVIMNNAGIVTGGRTWEQSLEDWHRVLDVNFWGVVHGIRTFVPLLLGTGEPGHVVNTASMAAITAVAGIAPYTATKHAVLGVSDVLRAELTAMDAPIGVSVVMPGMIRTGLNPIGTVEPTTVAANVVDAIRRGRPYVFTDDHSAAEVEARLGAIVAARGEVV